MTPTRRSRRIRKEGQPTDEEVVPEAPQKLQLKSKKKKKTVPANRSKSSERNQPSLNGEVVVEAKRNLRSKVKKIGGVTTANDGSSKQTVSASTPVTSKSFPSKEQPPGVGKRVPPEPKLAEKSQQISSPSIAGKNNNVSSSGPVPVPTREWRNRRNSEKKLENIPVSPSQSAAKKSVAPKTASPLVLKERPVLKEVDMDQFSERQTRSYQTDVIRVVKTPSFKETFAERLEWKKKHYDKPITSTPVPPKTKSAETTAKDLTSCFGFDDSTEDEDYHSVPISPIVRRKDRVDVERRGQHVVLTRVPQPLPSKEPAEPKKSEVEEHHIPNFNELLHKYVDDEEDPELHFNREGTKQTYTHSRKDVHFPPKLKHSRKKRERSTIIVSGATKSKKARNNPGHTKKHKEGEDGKLNPDMEKWLEEKNKEFDDILKFPLVVEKSPEIPSAQKF